MAPAVVAAGASIAATDGFDELQVNVTPLITLRSVSRAMARYARRRPSAVIVNVSGAAADAESNVTSMRVIGVSTPRLDTPTIAPLVARICVEPIVSALTAPVDALTDATEGAVDVQVKVGCAAMALPRPSTASAE